MDFLREILDRFEFESLIAEGKDPLEVLHYKYGYVPTDVIDSVVAIDPTKKKSYSQWLLSKWPDEKDVIVSNLKNGRIDQLFQHYKNHKDIQIKDCPSVEAGLRLLTDNDTVLSKSDEPMTYVENLGKEVDSDLADDFDIVFNEDGWIIAVPNTYEAECKLGENMKWCTANAFGNGYDYYKRYLSEGGKYYVNFNMYEGESANGKDYPFTRYQFHFESKQFMDKNDNPIDIKDVGMPDSAFEFYENEGYDSSYFESLEEKMERYEAQRDQYRYELVPGEIYLNIEYDDDYEFTEPTNSTDFFVFDENDVRDALAWICVPNPHTHKDVVVSKTDDWVILKTDNENKLLLVINESEDTSRRYSSYRDWAAYGIDTKYITLNGGVFAIDGERYDGRYYTYFATDGFNRYEKLNASECTNMFINEACTKADVGKWDRVFIETVSDGYHTLFTVSNSAEMGSDLTCLIKRDTPINGESFFINENGVIEGEYGKYRAYDDGTDDGQEYTKYHLVKKLSNGNYLVSVDTQDEETDEYRESLNVLLSDKRQLLFGEWFDKLLFSSDLLYVIQKGKKVGFFNANAQQIGEWYDNWGVLDTQNGIACGKKSESEYVKSYTLIDIQRNEAFAEFADILTPNPVNNKIIVRLRHQEGGLTGGIGYDYIERKFCYQEFSNIIRLMSYYERYFYCTLANTEEHAIFDFEEQKIVLRGITDIQHEKYANNFYRIYKSNGKKNIMNLPSYEQEMTLLLPYDVDEIIDVANYLNVVIFSLNNRYFIYNYEKQNFLLNQNGIPSLVTDIKINPNTGDLECEMGGIIFRFRFVNYTKAELYNCYRKGDDGIWYIIKRDEMTPEMINMYNQIVGQQNNVQEITMTQEYLHNVVMESVNRLLNESFEKTYTGKRTRQKYHVTIEQPRYWAEAGCLYARWKCNDEDGGLWIDRKTREITSFDGALKLPEAIKKAASEMGYHVSEKTQPNKYMPTF